MRVETENGERNAGVHEGCQHKCEAGSNKQNCQTEKSTQTLNRSPGQGKW